MACRSSGSLMPDPGTGMASASCARNTLNGRESCPGVLLLCRVVRNRMLFYRHDIHQPRHQMQDIVVVVQGQDVGEARGTDNRRVARVARRLRLARSFALHTTPSHAVVNGASQHGTKRAALFLGRANTVGEMNSALHACPLQLKLRANDDELPHTSTSGDTHTHTDRRTPRVTRRPHRLPLSLSLPSQSRPCSAAHPRAQRGST